MESQDLQDHQDQWEEPDTQDSQENKEHLVWMVTWDPQVCLAPKEIEDHRALTDSRELQDHRDLWEPLVPKEIKVNEERGERQEKADR